MPNPFKVIIVGGSVTGLTLAHSLDKAGIDYIVLEKHHEIHPQLGASVVIFPNGGRILEQLGVFRRVEKLSQKFSRIHSCFPDGFHHDSEAPRALKELFGTEFAILERRQLLEVLYTELQDKSRVHTGKQVTSVQSTSSGASVTTADGSTYTGDLVVGADGIHSFVRSEMWRIASLEQPGLITEKEKSSFKVQFTCIFGISNTIEGVKTWDHVIRYNKNLTLFVFPGSNNGVFWLLFQKLDTTYTYPHVPRFTTDDAIARCEALAGLAVWENIKFGDIWAQRRSFHMTALEEGLLRTWHYGRIVCVGDSVSKMTPNQGQGANTAIEAAAHLSNVLNAITKTTDRHKPGNETLTQALDSFNQAHLARLSSIHQASEFLTRLQACDGLVKSVFARYVAPYCGDATVPGVAALATTGPVLDFVPLTERSGRDWKGVGSWVPFVSSVAYLGTRGVVALGVVAGPGLVGYGLYKMVVSKGLW